MLQARIIDAELCRLRAAQIVDDTVDGPDQRLELFAPIRGLDVQRHALLAEVPGLEIFAVGIAQLVRPDMARRIAIRRLDLDDFGTQLGQEHGAVRTGAELLEREDTDALQRLGVHATAFRLTHWRAMMSRCISLVPSPMQVRGASR